MSSSTLQKGARVGKYRVVAHIATGGMGEVYRAFDEVNQRPVALKVLSPEMASNRILLERFKREAKAAALLDHRNIVATYESDEADGRHYIAMELIEGVDLAVFISRKGKIQHEEARRILIQACKALSHAFALGITHRDIKPSNFLLANEAGRTRVKLTDMGLSRMQDDEEFRVTRAGTTVGTVDYMSPEQARDSGKADIRSDIYSMGCTFYHMLAGTPPFAEGGIGERVYKHIAADPPDVRKFSDDIPAGLWTVLRRMLAKHPDDRFQTPDEVIEALRSLADDSNPDIHTPPVPAPPAQMKTKQTRTVKPDESGAVETQARAGGSETRADTPPSTRSTPRKPGDPTPSPAPPATPSEIRRSREEDRKPKRPTTLSEITTVADDPDTIHVSHEQRLAATGQFNHATEVIRKGGDVNYALQLLLSACKFDPTNTLYRKMLREVVKDKLGTKKAGWFGSLTAMPARSRLRTTRQSGDHRKVIEDGEEMLTRMPGDVPIQLTMAESACDLGLLNMAVWLLEEARRSSSDDVSVLRALAEVYGRQKRYNQAIAVYEKIRAADPSDHEAADKIKALSVAMTLVKGGYR